METPGRGREGVHPVLEHSSRGVGGGLACHHTRVTWRASRQHLWVTPYESIDPDQLIVIILAIYRHCLRIRHNFRVSRAKSADDSLDGEMTIRPWERYTRGTSVPVGRVSAHSLTARRRVRIGSNTTRARPVANCPLAGGCVAGGSAAREATLSLWRTPK